MDDKLIDLNNYEALRRAGKLLEGWALDPSSRPTAMGDFTKGEMTRRALEEVGLKFAKSVKEVELHQMEPAKVPISLPSAENLAARKKRNAQGTPYNLPTPFREIADGETDPDKLEEFYWFRLGDYVLTHCA